MQPESDGRLVQHTALFPRSEWCPVAYAAVLRVHQPISGLGCRGAFSCAESIQNLAKPHSLGANK